MMPESSVPQLFSDRDREAMLRVSDSCLLSGSWGAVERVADHSGERFVVYGAGKGLDILFEVRPTADGSCEIAEGRSGRILVRGAPLGEALREVLPLDGLGEDGLFFRPRRRVA